MKEKFFSRDSQKPFGIETPQTPQTPPTRQTLQTLQTTQPFKPLEPGQWFCHTGRFKPLELCQWFCRTGRWRRSKTSHLLDCGPWALCAGRRRRSKTLHLLDCGLWALCETVGCGVGALARQILGSAILAVGDARCSEPEFAQEMKENERKVFF